MHVQMRENWYVHQYYYPQKVIIRKGEIPFVWKFDAPHRCITGITLCPIEAQQFTGHTNRIQNDKRCVTKPDDKLWYRIDDIQAIVTVSNYFGD